MMAPDKDKVDYAKGETPMTDQQFAAYVELRDKYEALLELKVAPIVPGSNADEPVSDYQFKRFEQLRDECEELKNELALLKKENAGLKMQLDMMKSSSRRYRL